MAALIVVLVVAGVLLLAGSALLVSSRRRRVSARQRGIAPSPGAALGPDGALSKRSQEEEGPESSPGDHLSDRQGSAPLQERLGRARGLLSGYLDGIRARRSVDDATFELLEEAMIRADVGVATTTDVLAALRSKVASGEIPPGDPEALLEALQDDLRAFFAGDDATLDVGSGDGPVVWLFVGVNGVGKTTTIGKLALREAGSGRSVVLAAGDTFRAAAGEQLDVWAERSGSRIVQGSDGADPSSVIFDAVQHAAARGADVVLADSAGRLHTKVNLMEELRKVRRIADRPPGHVSEVLLVLDATTGQNGIVQARQFGEAVAVTGVVLTKLDGTAKGGVAIAIRSELGLPIKLVGLGEGLGDLVEFDAVEFADALFE